MGRYKRKNGCDSQQEEDFRIRYPHIDHKPKERLPYTLECHYLPDAWVGMNDKGYSVYVELKEYLTIQECRKYEQIATDNPDILLVMVILRAADNVFDRLNKHPRISAIQGYNELPPSIARLCDTFSSSTTLPETK